MLIRLTPSDRSRLAFSSETVAGFISSVHSVSALRVQPGAQAGKEVFELRRGQRAGRAAAEEDRARAERREDGLLGVEFEEEGVEKAGGFVAVGRLLVE